MTDKEIKEKIEEIDDKLTKIERIVDMLYEETQRKKKIFIEDIDMIDEDVYKNIEFNMDRYRTMIDNILNSERDKDN